MGSWSGRVVATVAVGLCALGCTGTDTAWDHLTCAELGDRLADERDELARSFGRGEDGEQVSQDLVQARAARPECFEPVGADQDGTPT